jgi:ParB/RepB/Spo0J family partition protein
VTTTLRPKLARVKEPTIKDLAKARARGSNGYAAHGMEPPKSVWQTLNEQMRKRAGLIANLKEADLSFEDRAFLHRVAANVPVERGDSTRLIMLLERHAKLLADKPKTGKVSRHSNGSVSVPASESLSDHAHTPAPSNAPTSAAGQVVKLKLSQLLRHPDNRKPTAEAIAKRAASMKDRGQLEPIVVRPLNDQRTKAPKNQKGKADSVLGTSDLEIFQVLSGETRWLAAKKLGWKEIDARVVALGHKEALELLAEANAQRQDLSPIDKAKLMKRLGEPIAQGGAGLTHDQIAPRFGYSDGSVVSNCLRLLKLPEPWLSRVASGELNESWARLICPLVDAPVVMANLEKDWQSAHRARAADYEREHWESRTGVEQAITSVLRGEVRPVEEGHSTHYSSDDIKGTKDEEYRYSGYHPRYFELTPELEQKLGIVEWGNIHFYHGKGSGDRVKGLGGKRVRMATNVKLYDQLNVPLIKAHVDKHKRAKVTKGAADNKAAKKALTPAEQKATAKEQAEQLQRRIDAWRHDWLKSLIARQMEREPQVREFVLIALAVRAFTPHWQCDLAELVAGEHFDEWAGLAAAFGKGRKLFELGDKVAAAAITAAEQNPKFPAIERERLDALAALANIDLAAEWRAMQDAQEDLRLNGDVAAESRFALFFELFQSGQLDDLGDELGVHVKGAPSKSSKVALLITRDRTLKLPKCLKPLAAGKAKKARR